jgi:hypothetical protein
MHGRMNEKFIHGNVTSTRVMTSPSLRLTGVSLGSCFPLSRARFVPRFVIVMSCPFEVSRTKNERMNDQ